MRTPEQALMEHFGAPTGDGFDDWVAITESAEDLAGLTERERSRARLIRVFNIAVIEALNREVQHGATAPEGICDMVFVMGMAAAGAALQVTEAKSDHIVRKKLAEAFSDGFREYARSVRKLEVGDD